MSPPPDAVEYAFDPHVAAALVCLAAALLIVLILSVIPIGNPRGGGNPSRRK